MLDFTINTLDEILSNLLPPKNVAWTFVFSVSANKPEQRSSCSDNSRLDPVLELAPRKGKIEFIAVRNQVDILYSVCAKTVISYQIFINYAA